VFEVELIASKVSKFQGLEDQVSKFQGFRVSRNPSLPIVVLCQGFRIFPRKILLSKSEREPATIAIAERAQKAGFKVSRFQCFKDRSSGFHRTTLKP
jgi:hypothetical protein